MLTVPLLVALATAAGAQQPEPVPLPRSFAEPIPLFTSGLGPLTRPISTTVREAQAYFDQGLQFLYAFTPEDAARSFREAWRRDPACAMCYFGEAWAWGPYLNGDMSADDAPRAFAAIEQARRLAAGRVTPVERALIDAMATRYRPVHDRLERERLDTAFAEAMAKVHAAFPADLDVGTLYAEALMLLEPRRGNWDLASPAVQQIHRILEDVLASDITHPGACHLFVHATESTDRPGLAEACAEHLGGAIPGASHINHMPSHTFNRVGRWGDAVRANIQAWHSDLKAGVGEGFAIYPSHNLHMLLFSASFDGQGAIAIQAGRDYAKIAQGGVFYHVLTLFRFGRFDELLEISTPPLANPIFQAFVDFGRGYAHLRLGRTDSARAHLARVDAAARAAGDSLSFRGHAGDRLLGVVAGILHAECLREEGRIEDAITALEQAVSLEDGIRYDEPEPLNFSARHWLGAVLLEAGRPADAERVYRTELEDHPRNGWSLYGLERALRDQGRTQEAAGVRAEFERAWARSDTWIRASRF